AEVVNFNATMSTTADTVATITDPDCAYGDIQADSTVDGDPDQYVIDLSQWPDTVWVQPDSFVVSTDFLVRINYAWEDVCGNTYTAAKNRWLDPPAPPSLYSPVAFADVNAARVAGGIEIKWNLAADELIDGFNVYRQRHDQTSEIRINGGGPIGRTQRSYIDNDVEPGPKYRYSVAVILSDGTEQRSPAVNASLGAYVTRLDQNRPNPFNPTTQIGYQVANDRRVTLKLYDVKGALVRELVDGVQSAGAYTVTWNGTNSAGQAVSTGVYFYRLTVGKFVQTRRMVLLK
ncbi:MAG: T9SS type A sorting domain-containing protein, partial [Candidatus Krumholzibacteria bacterium]|nr:T9SS type A sorting domain-containing protein [Candidatus Krumholzibacteria bacterium]